MFALRFSILHCDIASKAIASATYLGSLALVALSLPQDS